MSPLDKQPTRHPKTEMQLIGIGEPTNLFRTIEQLLAGKVIERPSWDVAVDETFKKAPKALARKHAQQKDLGI